MSASHYQQFWTHGSYAVVGHSARAKFPVLTYGALKAKGKKVFAVDPSATQIEGDRAFSSLADLPAPVDGVVLEVPREETAQWVERAADAGISRVWIHADHDTPEALQKARERGLDVCHGTCAVMYLSSGLSPHTIHGFVRKILGRY